MSKAKRIERLNVDLAGVYAAIIQDLTYAATATGGNAHTPFPQRLSTTNGTRHFGQ